MVLSFVTLLHPVFPQKKKKNEQSWPTLAHRFPNSSLGGFCPQHSGRGCIVDAMQAARHAGRDCPRFRRGCLQVGACHRRGNNSVASVDTTTLISGEHGELSHVSEVTPRVRTRGQRIGEANNPDDRRHDVLIDESRSHSRYGLRGVRVGEASHPGSPRRQSSSPIAGRDVSDPQDPFRWSHTGG